MKGLRITVLLAVVLSSVAGTRVQSPRNLRQVAASTDESAVGEDVLQLATFPGFKVAEPFWMNFGKNSSEGPNTVASPKLPSENVKTVATVAKAKPSGIKVPAENVKMASRPRPLAPPSDTENPKCDQVCTNGSEGRRTKCRFQCAKMQTKVCPKEFEGCHKACANDVPSMPADRKCEQLCEHVKDKICNGLGYQAPKDRVSPHHDDQPPPSIEATAAPRIYKGSFMFCNLYPASYEFEVLALKDQDAKSGTRLTKLGYKQCDRISMQSLQSVGIRVPGKEMSAVSKPIVKIPSVMVFGQWAFGNHQIEFNRYFARGSGAMLCNAYPAWESTEVSEEVTFYRGGYQGKKLGALRYKECVPTALGNGDDVAAVIRDQQAGELHVLGNPKAIILGKAGQSTAVAFESWTGADEVSL